MMRPEPEHVDEHKCPTKTEHDRHRYWINDVTLVECPGRSSVSTPLEGIVVCPATAAKCRCRHELGHEPELHECVDIEECNGAWLGSDHDGGEIQGVRFPRAFGLAAFLGLPT